MKLEKKSYDKIAIDYLLVIITFSAESYQIRDLGGTMMRKCRLLNPFIVVNGADISHPPWPPVLIGSTPLQRSSSSLQRLQFICSITVTVSAAQG